MRARYKNTIYSIFKAEVKNDGLRLYYIPTSQSGSYGGYGGRLSIEYLSIETGSDIDDCKIFDELLNKGYVDLSEYTVKEHVG